MHPGGRGTSGLAFWLRLSLAALAYALGQAGAAAQSGVASVEVRQTAEGYAADVVMHARVPRELAYAVLTDFDHMARWVPNVRDSRVLKREANRVTVVQQGVAEFGPLSFPFTTVREIEFAAPSFIHSVQVSGSMKRLESWMKLAADGAATRLDYHVELEPGAVAGAVLSKRFLEHEFREQFDAIVAEMERRGGDAGPTR